VATIYLRGNIWWVSWGSGPNRKQKSTGIPVEKRAEAERTKRNIERELEKQAALAEHVEPGRTFRAYRLNWVAERKRNNVGSAKDDEVRLKHVQKDLDELDMRDIRPRHLEEAINRLKREKKLAPRSIRHIGGVLSVLFRSAYAEDVIPANPLPFRRGILPAKKDAKPAWRATAVFAREEVELLISSPLVPDERRMRYALFFLTGCRLGEVSDRRWRDYDDAREPLGCLHVHSSFNTKRQESKETKTGVVRLVPVHPVLARALAAWRKGGAVKLLGHEPRPDDLVVPGPGGKHLTTSVGWKRLAEDLRTLSLRPRRLHDARRAFVSLALTDGARGDILKWVTHGAPGDVMSLYTTLPWPALCEAVLHLKIRADVFATDSLHSTTVEA
jgi:integrase